jgi:hypothetical protein
MDDGIGIPRREGEHAAQMRPAGVAAAVGSPYGCGQSMKGGCRIVARLPRPPRATTTHLEQWPIDTVLKMTSNLPVNLVRTIRVSDLPSTVSRTVTRSPGLKRIPRTLNGCVETSRNAGEPAA